MGTNTTYGEPLYFGQTPKYNIEITAGDLDMLDYDFTVRLQRGPNSVIIPKSQMIVDNEDWYLTFDTKALGVGTVRAIVIAEIPDTDYQGGVRTEICVIEHFAEILAL